MSSAQPTPSDSTKRIVLQPYKPPAALTQWKDEGESLKTTPPGGEQPKITFTVLLKQRNTDQLEKLSQEVADPRSSRYGKFMTPQEIAELVNPPQADQERVITWLKQSLTLPSEKSIENRGDMIKVHDATISEVEKLFGCTMHKFTELPPPSGIMPQPTFHPRTTHRCVGDVTIPSELGDIVTGTIGIMEMPPKYTGRPHPHPVTNTEINPLGGEHQSKDSHPSNPGEDKEHSNDSNDLPTKDFHIPVAHPHRTLRTPEQLAKVAMDFERERMQQ